MAETKKEKVVEEPEQTTSTTPPKKKSNTVLYIIIGIVVFLIVLAVVAFFVVKGLVKKGVDSLEQGQEFVEQISDDYEEEEEGEEDEDDDTWLYKKSTEETVDGKLEKENLINKNFPDDIPLPGGLVTASSYSSDYSVDVEIDINSTVEEILDWYEKELEEETWVVTSRSSQEDVEGWVSGRLDFESEDGERSFRMSLDTNPYQDYTTITITEYYY